MLGFLAAFRVVPRVVGLRGLRVKWRSRNQVVVFTVVSHLMVLFSKGIRVSGLEKKLPSVHHLLALVVQFFGPAIHTLDSLGERPFGGQTVGPGSPL
eukprot:12923711-Heterocapsa_arctica.AAC.2